MPRKSIRIEYSEECDEKVTEFDLDEVLKILKFGKFQMFVFFLLSVPIFIGGIQYSYIFTAGIVKYRFRKKKIHFMNKFIIDKIYSSLRVDA